MEATITKPRIVLPSSPIMSTLKNPKNLIIFSKPKTGKTTLLSKLPNCLIADFEDGSDYVDAMKVKIIGITAPKTESETAIEARYNENKYYINEFTRAIREAGYPYQRVGIDTITAVEEMCIPYAEELYAKSPMGKNWYSKDENGVPNGGKSKYGNILNLPDGAGYKWLKDAFDKVLAVLESWAPEVIISGHVKDIKLEKADAVFNSADLDLTGKLKRSTASDSDGIGYLFRRGNQTILSFKSSDEVSCGSRCAHLRGKEIIIAEENLETGEVETFWERIYPDL